MQPSQGTTTSSFVTESSRIPVPFLDLARSQTPLRDQLVEALARVCDSGAFVLGPEVERLEQAMSHYCHCEHAIACASGSDALLLALMALGIGPGDEVIIPSFTFFATASAVVRLGAKPVFADIDPLTYNISPREVARLIHKNTKAIIPVHLFGQAAEMEPILDLAKQHEIFVIEDAAQAIGAEYQGHRVGSLGNIACFSFYPTKNLGAMGDAGMLTTRDADLAEQLRVLRVHGMKPRYYHLQIGINSRMDAFHAATLLVKLNHLESWVSQRKEIADRYYQLFTEFKLDRVVILPHVAPHRRLVWNQFVIRVPHGQRDALRAYLQDRHIGTEIYYPLGLHEQACFQDLGYAPSDLPATFAATREVLALPIFPGLTAEEQRSVVASIAEFFDAHPPRLPVGQPYFLKHATTTRERQRTNS